MSETLNVLLPSTMKRQPLREIPNMESGNTFLSKPLVIGATSYQLYATNSREPNTDINPGDPSLATVSGSNNLFIDTRPSFRSLEDDHGVKSSHL